jgi:hypothetical protein
MNYQELRSLVGGASPQSASYQDIISGIQSQYTPQTQFAPTRSLLDTLGEQLPDQPRIAYGSLLQAQPRVLPTPMTAVSIKNPDAVASVDSGVINLGANTANTGLASDIKSESDAFNLATKIALLAAGPAGGVVNAAIGAATGNNRQLIDALAGLANPTVGALNAISSALTGQSLGTFGSGLLSAPTGSISDLGLLGASQYGNAIDRSAADINDILRDAITRGGGKLIDDNSQATNVY